MTGYQNAKGLIKDTAHSWNVDKAPKLAAALAYYTVISLAPLLLIVIGVASIFFKGEAVRGQIADQISGLVGAQSAEMIQSLLANSQKGHGVVATIVGLLTMFIGSSGVFGELQDSLNIIWHVEPKESSGIKELVKSRFLSFAMVLGMGFLLTVSLILSAAISAVTKYFHGENATISFLWQLVDLFFSIGITSVLFTLIFKVLPDTHLTWKDTWLGGLLTGFLFALGKVLLGLYLGQASVTSGYGAAGSVIIISIWLYYTAQILFIGAEFTRAYAMKFGSKVGEPKQSQLKNQLNS
jgi:membrane protein